MCVCAHACVDAVCMACVRIPVMCAQGICVCVSVCVRSVCVRARAFVCVGWWLCVPSTCRVRTRRQVCELVHSFEIRSRLCGCGGPHREREKGKTWTQVNRRFRFCPPRNIKQFDAHARMHTRIYSRTHISTRTEASVHTAFMLCSRISRRLSWNRWRLSGVDCMCVWACVCVGECVFMSECVWVCACL